MRLGKMSKKALMGNYDLLKYCTSCGIDMNKMLNCNIEKMGNIYVFVLDKENVPKSQYECHLDIDIASQPDIILKMEYLDNDTWDFTTTKYTKRVLTS